MLFCVYWMCKGDNIPMLYLQNLFNAAKKTIPATHESQGAEVMSLGFPHLCVSDLSFLAGGEEEAHWK